MTAEMWVMIGTGLGMVGAMGFFFRLLNTRIGDVRIDMQRMELRLNDRIDGVEKRLNGRIDEVEEHLDEKIDGVEKRLNGRIDEVEERLDEKIDGVEKRLNGRIDEVEERLSGRMERMENRLTVRMDGHDRRFDTVDERLRAVERGNAEVVGAVNMMQTIVIETLNREMDSERSAVVGAD